MEVIIASEGLALILIRSEDKPTDGCCCSTVESCKPAEVADVGSTGVQTGYKAAEAVPKVSLFVSDARAGRPSLGLPGVCFNTALSLTDCQPAPAINWLISHPVRRQANAQAVIVKLGERGGGGQGDGSFLAVTVLVTYGCRSVLNNEAQKFYDS